MMRVFPVSLDNFVQRDPLLFPFVSNVQRGSSPHRAGMNDNNDSQRVDYVTDTKDEHEVKSDVKDDIDYQTGAVDHGTHCQLTMCLWLITDSV